MLSSYTDFIDLANTYYDEKDYTAALSYAKKAKTLASIPLDAHFIAGMSNYFLQNYREAIDELETFQMITQFDKNDRKYFDSDFTLANCYYNVKDYSQSIFCYKSCINRFEFIETDFEYIQKQNIALKKLNEIMSEAGSELLSKLGLIDILTKQDNSLVWENIIQHYAITNGFNENVDLIEKLKFTLTQRKEGCESESEILLEEWFFKKVNNTQYKPVKSDIGFDNKNYAEIIIQRPSVNVKIVSSSYYSYTNGTIMSMDSSDWQLGKNGIWEIIDDSGMTIYMD